MPTKRCIRDLDHKSIYPKRLANPIIFLHTWTKGIMFWFGEMTTCVEGMHACGYKHTIKNPNLVYMQLHNSFSHTLYTYAVKYTCTDLVKRKTVAKYGTWVTLMMIEVHKWHKHKPWITRMSVSYAMAQRTRRRVHLNSIYTKALWH